MKSRPTIIFLFLLCLFVVFFHLHMLFTFSALISNIYWCGIVSHQQILMVRHVALAEIIGAANAAPASPVPTPMLGACYLTYYIDTIVQKRSKCTKVS